jgi:long-chain acyl-CoA synthetase
VPVNTRWRRQEVQWLAENLPLTCVLTTEDLREAWLGVSEHLPPERVVSVAGIETGSARPASQREPFKDHPLVYYLTSGSTGRPKIAQRTHNNLLVAADNVGQVLGVKPGMRFLGAVPFHHPTGLSNCILLALMNGASIVTMRSFHPRDLMEVVRSEKVEVINASPFVFRTVVESVSDARAFRTVKICTSSGAPMPAEVTQQCRESLGLVVRQLYGSSETSTISIETADATGIEGSAGKILPHVQVRILRPDESLAPPGEAGEIAVRSPAMTPGYVGEPESIERNMADAFYRTGDRGWTDGGGNLFITGRLKRVINVGGSKVDPVEIEKALAAMPEVQKCLVSGIASSRQTEIIAAQIVPRPGQHLSRAQVVEYLRGVLAEYKIPRVIQIMDALPVEATGKTPAPWSEVQ